MHPRATIEASDGPRPPRGAAISGRIVSAGVAEEGIALRISSVAGAAAKPHAAIDLLRISSWPGRC